MAAAAPAASNPDPRDWKDVLYVLGMVFLGPIGVAIMLMGRWSQRTKVTAAVLWLMVFGAAFGLQWLLVPTLALMALALVVTGSAFERAAGAVALALFLYPAVAVLLPLQRDLQVTRTGSCTTVFVQDRLPGAVTLPLHASACSSDGVERYSWEDCGGSGWLVKASIACTHEQVANGALLLRARADYSSAVIPGFTRSWSRVVQIDPDGSVHELVG